MLILVTLLIIGKTVYAKYSLTYYLKVAQVYLQSLPPALTVDYQEKENTVVVTITSDDIINGTVEGWTLSEDKHILVREYEKGISERVKVPDKNGRLTWWILINT